MYKLARFDFADMMACRAEIRRLLDSDPATYGEAASRLTSYLYENLVDDNDLPACALVRNFRTQDYSKMGAALQAFARRVSPGVESVQQARCLVLAATRGEQPEWNDVSSSRGHRAIPLLSKEMIDQAPMISQLIRSLGVDTAELLLPERPGPLPEEARTYDVFYVPEAQGSLFIVAQDEFVKPAKIRSVLAFGGMASLGTFVATILFSKVFITPEAADLFKVIGLNVRLALIPFARKPLFESPD